MADEDHSGMNIREQEKTFDGFIGLATKAIVIIVVLLVFMALANG